LLNFKPEHLVAEIILEHPFLCHFMGLVDICGHVLGFSIFALQKDVEASWEKVKLHIETAANEALGKKRINENSNITHHGSRRK